MTGDPNEESVQVLAAGEPAGPTSLRALPHGGTSGHHAEWGAANIVVDRSLDDVADARAAVSHALWIGVPAVFLVAALVTWWIAGVTLAPVRSASDRQRRFVADAAHELRSPIASIRQHAEVAPRIRRPPTWRELATTVTEESIRLQAIVDDLLLLARFDEGAMRLTHAEVVLDDVVLAEAARLRDASTLAIDSHSVTAARVTGSIAISRGSCATLARTPPPTRADRIDLSLAARDGHAVLTVDDDGAGIPEPERARVFERFVRLDEARIARAAARAWASRCSGVGAHTVATSPCRRPARRAPGGGPSADDRSERRVTQRQARDAGIGSDEVPPAEAGDQQPVQPRPNEHRVRGLVQDTPSASSAQISGVPPGAIR